MLRNSTHVNIIDNNEAEGDDSGDGDIINRRKCGKCKEYGHYAKTCQAEL